MASILIFVLVYIYNEWSIFSWPIKPLCHALPWGFAAKETHYSLGVETLKELFPWGCEPSNKAIVLMVHLCYLDGANSQENIYPWRPNKYLGGNKPSRKYISLGASYIPLGSSILKKTHILECCYFSLEVLKIWPLKYFLGGWTLKKMICHVRHSRK